MENIVSNIDWSKTCPVSSNFKNLQLACCTLGTANVHESHTFHQSQNPETFQNPSVRICVNNLLCPVGECYSAVQKNKHSVCNIDDPINDD